MGKHFGQLGVSLGSAGIVLHALKYTVTEPLSSSED